MSRLKHFGRANVPSAALAATLVATAGAAYAGEHAGGASAPGEHCLKQVSSYEVPRQLTQETVAAAMRALTHDLFTLCHPSLVEVKDGTQKYAGNYVSSFNMYGPGGGRELNILVTTRRPATSQDSWQSVTSFSAITYGRDGNATYMATAANDGRVGHDHWIIEDAQPEAQNSSMADVVTQRLRTINLQDGTQLSEIDVHADGVFTQEAPTEVNAASTADGILGYLSATVFSQTSPLSH